MQQINVFGHEIRLLRKKANESLVTTADQLGIDRSHLNKIELGRYKPSEELLDKIIAHFSVEGKKARQLRDFLERGPVEHVVVGGLEGRGKEMPQEAKIENPSLQVNVDPTKVPILYSNSVFVSSNDYGLVLDVAQTAPGSQNQQFIVSRIGMSFDHAKKMIEVINDHLQKNER